jgi:SAM-dependent methyltransferase
VRRDFAKEYGGLEEWHWWFRGRRLILETVLNREFERGKSRSILSVGCGPADGLKWLIPLAGPGGKVTGLDIEPLHARNVPEGVEFAVGSLEEASLEPASFDVVLALDVLEHLDDDVNGLKQAVRLVRPGGLLLVTVPALQSLWGGQDVVSEHRRRYTRGSLVRLFDVLDLSGETVSYFNTLLFPLIASVRLGRRAMCFSERAESDFKGARPGLLNQALEVVFGSEKYLIGRTPLPIGVSLMATYRLPR